MKIISVKTVVVNAQMRNWIFVKVVFALATPNWLIQEAIRSDVPWREAVVGAGLPVHDGYILPPTAPGLGINVDEQEAAKHPFEQEVLMQWWHQDGAVADW